MLFTISLQVGQWVKTFPALMAVAKFLVLESKLMVIKTAFSKTACKLFRSLGSQGATLSKEVCGEEMGPADTY